MSRSGNEIFGLHPYGVLDTSNVNLGIPSRPSAVDFDDYCSVNNSNYKQNGIYLKGNNLSDKAVK